MSTNNAINNLSTTGAVSSINTQASNYTLVLGDANNVLIQMTSATSSNLTIPPNSSAAIPVNSVINGYQDGVGQVTIVAGSGVTIKSALGALKTSFQYSAFTLTKIATNTWLVTGDLTT